MTGGSTGDPAGPEELVAVGLIARPHGVQGEVSVQVLTDVPSRFEPGSVLGLEGGGTLTVEAARPHRERLLVKFREIADRTEAEGLRDRHLLVPSSQVPEAPEDAYWPHDLEGCQVTTEDGRALGRIEEVLRAPANDVWVARDGTRETLIPAVRDVVVSVDVGARRVVVRDVEGL